MAPERRITKFPPPPEKKELVKFYIRNKRGRRPAVTPVRQEATVDVGLGGRAAKEAADPVSKEYATADIATAVAAAGDAFLGGRILLSLWILRWLPHLAP